MSTAALCGGLLARLTTAVRPQSADGTVRAVGLEDLTRAADRIVVAEVVGSETFSETLPVKRDARTGRQYHYTAPYTYHTLRVSATACGGPEANL